MHLARTMILLLLLIQLSPAIGAEPGEFIRSTRIEENLVELVWNLDRLRELSSAQQRFVVKEIALPDGARADLELESFSVTSASTQFLLGRSGPDESYTFKSDRIHMFRGRVRDRKLDAPLRLVRPEGEAHPERHFAESRAHQVDDCRIVAEVGELEGSVGAAGRAAQTGSPVGRQGVQHQGDPGVVARIRIVNDRDAQGGRPAGYIADPLGRLRRRERGERVGRDRLGCGRRPENHGEESHRDAEPEREAFHPVAARSGWGHITANEPSTKMAPPIQIQLTKGLQ